MFCAVEECRTRLTGSSQSSFRFPSDSKLRLQWTLFCRRIDDINYPVERICLEHFEMEDFERDLRLDWGVCGYLTPLKLKPEAVPSLQSHQDMDLEIVEEHLLPPETKEETLMVQYDKEPARDQPEESESDYEFEELPAEECLQVQVVDADGYLKVLEKENSELKRDNLIMNLSIQTSERDTERLQRQLDKSNELYGQLVTNLERIFSSLLQNDRRIV
ncbi:uncharacterized protein LOC108159722 [Drosophila miranda]|uniref:uncharacterized protein LOC108159722 n=1 Tax=Drosophila miranda TaxID=7229 RepID=UPI0007E5E9B0|nr:uncharacterized protein LOC108159722 [Drosophila miranda]